MPLFKHKPTIVDARRLKQQVDCYSKRDGVAIPAQPGDWLIINRETGEVYRVEHEDFIRLYEPEGPEASAYYSEARLWEFDED